MSMSGELSWVLACAFLAGACGDGGTPSTAGSGGAGNHAGAGGQAAGGAGTGGSGAGGSGAGATAGAGGSGQITLGGDGVLQIWTVGDSITEGVNNGYRNQIWTALTAGGYTLDFVGSLVHPYPDSAVCPDADHDGHAGYTISGIRNEIDAWYGQIAVPDVALVMAGTNDLAWWVAPGTDMAAPAADLVALADHILGLDPELAVIVGTIAPESSQVVADINRDRAELVTEFNQALATAVAGHALYGTRLWLADINAVLAVADLYDGIHPTRAAADKVANAWLSVLGPRLAPP